MGTKLEEFVNVQVDSITKKVDNDEFENQQDGIEAFYDEIENFVKTNYHRADAVFVEYDPDYDKIERVGPSILACITGHGLIDYVMTDLFGVEIYVLVITKE